MQSETHASPVIERWIGDYVAVGFEPIDPEMRDVLDRVLCRSRRIWRWVCAASVLGAIGIIILLNHVMSVGGPSHLHLGLLPILGVLPLMLYIGSGHAHWQAARRARQSLTDGRCEIYICVLDKRPHEHADGCFDAQMGLAPDPAREMLVFAGSGTLAAIDGRIARPGQTVLVSEIERSPPEAFFSPQKLPDRELTEAEKREVQRHVRSLRHLRLVHALAFTLPFLPFISIPLWIYLLISTRDARALRRNVRALLRRPMVARLSPETAGEVGLATPDLHVERVIEVDQRSGLVWTVDGVPADWRRSRLKGSAKSPPVAFENR